MKIELKRTIRDNEFAGLRNCYLDGLPEPQELFLEMKARASEAYSMHINHNTAGYYLLENNKDITEFFLLPEHIPNTSEIFEMVLEDHTIKTIFCKSFDTLLLSLCLDKRFEHSIDGYLFRHTIAVSDTAEFPAIKVRPGRMEDIETILAVNDGFFVSLEEITTIIRNNNLFYFHNNETFNGCGIFQKVIPGREAYDIGMFVSPVYRRKGIGTHIIRYLKEYCLSNGWRPICGCDFRNIASRKTLEKAGYITCDRLIRFKVGS